MAPKKAVPSRDNHLPTINKYTLNLDGPELHLTSYHPPPTFLYQHGGGNEQATPMNHEFAVGFSQNATFLGIDRKKRRNDGASMFNALLQDGNFTHIGGRSLGSVAAVNALLGDDGGNITHLIILSYPFDDAYQNGNARLLKRIPNHVKILFITGDDDRMGKQDENGKSLDNAYTYIDSVFDKKKTPVWRINLRNCSHGSNVSEENGGMDATRAILRIAGQVASVWLNFDSNSSDAGREGAVWYDVPTGVADWTGWHKRFRLKEAEDAGY